MNKKYFWYGDDELKIILDKLPHNPEIRYPEPTDSDTIKKDKKKKPIYIRKSFNAYIMYKGLTYTIPIEQGLCTDGSTIIRLLWTLIGETPYSPNLIIGSILHDEICNKPCIVEYDRILSTKIFRGMAISGGTPVWKINIMCFFINCWQFLIGNWNSSINGILSKIIYSILS